MMSARVCRRFWLLLATLLRMHWWKRLSPSTTSARQSFLIAPDTCRTQSCSTLTNCLTRTRPSSLPQRSARCSRISASGQSNRFTPIAEAVRRRPCHSLLRNTSSISRMSACIRSRNANGFAMNAVCRFGPTPRQIWHAASSGSADGPARCCGCLAFQM